MQKKPQHLTSTAHKAATKRSANTNKQDVDMQFDKELKKVGGPSLWFAIVVLLMCSPTFCHVMLHTVFAKILNCNFQTRCRIPQLEKKNWSFEQMQHISAPLDEKIWNCTYYKYNYTIIAHMNYEQALMYVETVERPETACCRKYVHKGCEIYSVYEEFSLVCRRAPLEKILNISPIYGKIIASILLVPLADLFGRKRLVSWGANLFIAGAVIMSTARSVQILIIGRVLVGMAYATMIYPIEAIAVEISNVRLRPLRFIAIHMGIGVGFIMIPLIATKIWNWRILQWTVCSSLLIFPLTTWYVPESPRWLMSKRKKAKAWAILRTVNNPVTQSDLLLFYRNEKRNCTDEIKVHLTEFKPFLSKLSFLMVLAFLIGGVYFKNYVGRFPMKVYTSRSNYFILSGIVEIFSYISCLPLLLILDRKIIMGLSFLCGGIAYLVASQLTMGTIQSLIFLLATELATGIVYTTSVLYITEKVPTSHRCTATGIACGFGAGLSTIIMFHTYDYLIVDNLFIILSCLCFIGVPVSLFAEERKNKKISDTMEETCRSHEN